MTQDLLNQFPTRLASPKLCAVIRIIVKKDSMILGGMLLSNWPVRLQRIALNPTMRPTMMIAPGTVINSCEQMSFYTSN